MYAHQVIEDLKTMSKRTQYVSTLNPALDSSYFQALSKIISVSNKFHMHIDIELSAKICSSGTQVFNGDNGGVNLPYNICWFDFFRPMEEEKTKKYGGRAFIEGQLPVTKRGIYCVKLNDNLFYAQVFNKIQSHWIPSFILHTIAVESTIREHADFLNKIKMFANIPYNFDFRDSPDHITAASLPLLPFSKMGLSFEQYKLEDGDEISNLNVLLKLLNCKNISTIDNEPPAKLNKSRAKKGKQPLFTYKTLVIKPTSKRQQSLEAQGLWENRIHLCRGHFKEYSSDKPLFGKYTGRYWWQPSVRGRNTDGVVMKDYEVKAAA